MNCLINGQAISSVNVASRAIHYGDGLFETIAVKHGVMPFWSAHYQRLCLGCERLKLSIPNQGFLLQEIDAVKKNHENAIIKIIITRQALERGYSLNNTKSVRIVQCYPYPIIPQRYYEHGVIIRFCQTPVSVNSRLAGIKHLNRLDSVLAGSEWQDTEIAEGLMCNDKNQVIQGTKSNVFAVKNNALYTPDLDKAGVLGVMRAQVLRWAQTHQITTHVQAMTRNDLFNMDELFLTNSVFGIWPVALLEDHHYSIGEITRKLMDEFK